MCQYKRPGRRLALIQALHLLLLATLREKDLEAVQPPFLSLQYRYSVSFSRDLCSKVHISPSGFSRLTPTFIDTSSAFIQDYSIGNPSTT